MKFNVSIGLTVYIIYDRIVVQAKVVNIVNPKNHFLVTPEGTDKIIEAVYGETMFLTKQRAVRAKVEQSELPNKNSVLGNLKLDNKVNIPTHENKSTFHQGLVCSSCNLMIDFHGKCGCN